MTLTERILWCRLKGRQMDGWKFRRQHPIGNYVVDFYCPAARLVIELQGSSHDHEKQFDYDDRRQAWLESKGYRVLRLKAYYPEQDPLAGAWDTIQLELTRLSNPAAPPALRATSPRSGEDI